MRTKIIYTTIFILLFAFSLNAQHLKEVNIQTSAQCEMCKDRIESNMAFEKGVKDVILDMETKKLLVVYKSKKTDPDAIKKAIAKLGYDADEIKGDLEAYKKLPKCCKKPEDR